MQWIDTHAHLNDPQFDDQRPEVLRAAREAGVVQTVVIGIDAATSRKACSLAADNEPLFAVVGIQPNSLERIADDEWEQIMLLADKPKVVALGETGLDRYWNSTTIDRQRALFLKHLEFARERDLPVVIHCRDAQADVAQVLREFVNQRGGPVRGVMHSFTGDWETAAACMELGLYISFAGMVTFKKNSALRDVASRVPLERLLVETDSPYLSPHPLRGKMNQPSHIVHTGACLAKVRGIEVAALAAATTANTRALFRLPTVSESVPGD